MHVVRRYSVPLILICILSSFAFLLLNPAGDYENEYLLLVLNSIFLGLFPLAVCALCARAYLKNGVTQELLVSCGMLILCIGSVVAACARFLPDSANYSVTTFNLSAFVCAVLNLAAATSEKLRRGSLELKKRAWRLGQALLCACALAAAELVCCQRGLIPAFFTSAGSTQMRDIVLCLTVSFFFGAAVSFRKQYIHAKAEYLYWYSASMLLLAAGLFTVLFVAAVGSPLSWAGRACESSGARSRWSRCWKSCAPRSPRACRPQRCCPSSSWTPKRTTALLWRVSAAPSSSPAATTASFSSTPRPKSSSAARRGAS